MERKGGAAQADHVLAETPQPSGGLVFVIVLVLLALLAAIVIVVVLGCVFAWRAGRGSQQALVGSLVVAALEICGVFVLLPTVLESGASYDLGLLAVPPTVQVALYLAGRWRRSRGP